MNMMRCSLPCVCTWHTYGEGLPSFVSAYRVYFSPSNLRPSNNKINNNNNNHPAVSQNNATDIYNTVFQCACKHLILKKKKKRQINDTIFKHSSSLPIHDKRQPGCRKKTPKMGHHIQVCLCMNSGNIDSCSHVPNNCVWCKYQRQKL